MARPREHSVAELRELALAAAARLLEEQGAEALSTRRIAAQIGYSAASLYSVFRSRDDLCWQLNARTLIQLHQQLDRVAPSAPRERLKAFARAYLDFARSAPARWSLLFEHSTPESLEVPSCLGASITQLFGQLEQPLQALAPDAPVEDIRLNARTLWGAVHGITVLQLRGKLFLSDEDQAQRMLLSLIDHYLDGWLGDREVQP